MGVDLPTPAPADDAPTALATAIMPGTAAGQGLTAQLEALKGQGGGGDVDLDLGGLDMTGEPGGALDLDVGNSSASGEGAFAATQRLSGQPALSESEPATMSEVGTKLDLARAYMDMGDPEGARSILEEVLAEGSASQKTEARRLVDSLPGLTLRPMGRVAIGVEYDGAAYHGWQRQPHSTSVQETLQAGAQPSRRCAGGADLRRAHRCRRPCPRTGGALRYRGASAARVPGCWASTAYCPPRSICAGCSRSPDQFHARYGALRRSLPLPGTQSAARARRWRPGGRWSSIAPLDAALMQAARA